MLAIDEHGNYRIVCQLDGIVMRFKLSVSYIQMTNYGLAVTMLKKDGPWLSTEHTKIQSRALQKSVS